MTPGGLFLPHPLLPQPDFLVSCPTRHLKLCQHPGILAENPHQFSPTFSLGKGSCQHGQVSLKEAAHTETGLFPFPAHPLLAPCLAADNELGLPKGQLCPLHVFVLTKRVLVKLRAHSVWEHTKGVT
uniref:Uncharacterized protein n=1 Tax=Saimiri boliviensis boliviensis TaxID=39432 RepID=A0A2K6UKV4_SAIBB